MTTSIYSILSLFSWIITDIKQDVFLWNMDAPTGKKVKICKSYIFIPSTPREIWCQWSVHNPYMNLQSKFGYCITTQVLHLT